MKPSEPCFYIDNASFGENSAWICPDSTCIEQQLNQHRIFIRGRRFDLWAFKHVGAIDFVEDSGLKTFYTLALFPPHS